MEDSNLILTIETPSGGPLGLPHNRDRYISRETTSSDDAQSRESTPSIDGESDECDSLAPDRLYLRFNQPPKNAQRGFAFGSDKKACDVLLVPRRGQGNISGIQFYIIFDWSGNLVVVDESKHGTSVSYDGWGKRVVRCHFRWILFPEKDIRIHLPDDSWVRVVLARHDTCKKAYLAALSCFLERQGIACPTHHHAWPLPARQESIYLPGKELGTGSFGKVSLATDVSTGIIYAAKEFNNDTGFAKEVQIMKHISHDHTVKFIDFITDPSPQVIMEYMPLGNLAHQHTQHPLTGDETQKLLVQGIRALHYLHDHLPRPVVHRDIKPENILIRGRRKGFHVKLADFGLSQDISFLKTECGTPIYVAPEIRIVADERDACMDADEDDGSGDGHGFEHIRYDKKVDIWSLGVVVLEYSVGLPEFTLKSMVWCATVSEAAEFHASDRGEDPMFGLLREMLRIKPAGRLSADECLNWVRMSGLDGISASHKETTRINAAKDDQRKGMDDDTMLGSMMSGLLST